MNMNFIIEGVNDLNHFLYNSFKQYDDCVITLYDDADHYIYYTITTINDNEKLINITFNNDSFGKSFNIDSTEEVFEWIKETCIFEDENSIIIKVLLNIKDNVLDEDIDINPFEYMSEVEKVPPKTYQDKYLLYHDSILNSEPIELNSTTDAYDIFTQFLNNPMCDKLIFQFLVFMEDIQHTFLLNITIDKNYVGEKTYVCISTKRPDLDKLIKTYHGTDSMWILDSNMKDYKLIECYQSIYYGYDIQEYFREILNHAKLRAKNVSCGKNRIHLFTYSNCFIERR